MSTDQAVGNSAVDGGGMDDRMGNSVDDGSSVVCGCNSMGDSLRVGSSTVIGDLSNVAVVRVRVVVHVLDAAVRESNRVRSLSVACTIICLSGVEVGVGVVISNGVVVGVGRDLIGVNLSGTVGRGSVSNHWGVVGRGGVNNRGSVDNSMGKPMSNNSMGKTMSNKAVSDNTVGNTVTHKSMSKVRAAVGNVRGVVDGGHVGTESLGLGGGPVLSLEGLAHRL